MHDDAFKNRYSEYVTFQSSICLSYAKSLQHGNQLMMQAKHLQNKSLEYWIKNLHIFLTPGNHIRFIFSWPWNLKYEKSLNLTVHWKSLYPILMIIWFVFILMVVTFFNNLKYSIVFLMGFETFNGCKEKLYKLNLNQSRFLVNHKDVLTHIPCRIRWEEHRAYIDLFRMSCVDTITKNCSHYSILSSWI